MSPQTSGLLSTLKGLLLPGGTRVRQIPFGLLKGLRMPLNLQNDFQLYLGLREREHHKWTRKLSRGIETFIDLGASKGPYTLYALANTTASRVIAIEPREELHKDLRRSVGLNDLPLERLELYAYRIGAPHNDRERSLDRLFSSVAYPCFIKCDVDGPEAEVLEGANQLLTHGDVRLLIETHSKEAEDRCIRMLTDWDFLTETIRPAWWRAILPDQRPIEHNQWIVAQDEDHILTP